MTCLTTNEDQLEEQIVSRFVTLLTGVDILLSGSPTFRARNFTRTPDRARKN